MKTHEIIGYSKNILKYHCFVGYFPCDELPSLDRKPAAFVINTETSAKPSKHFVASIIFNDGSGEYFDPYGFLPMKFF